MVALERCRTILANNHLDSLKNSQGLMNGKKYYCQDLVFLRFLLLGGEEWMVLAERLGLTPAEIRFLDRRVLNPFDAALVHARKQGLIKNVGDLYDKLVDCKLPRLADLL